MSGFPTQIFLLTDDAGEVRNLIYMAMTGEIWVREDNEWVDFDINESDPSRQFESMTFTSVDPRFIDFYDSKGGEVTYEDASDYKYTYILDSEYMKTDPDSDNLEK
jgi:hypothetical protein